MKEEIKVTNSEWYVMNCLWEKSHLSLMQLVPLLKESAGLEQEHKCNDGCAV